MARASNDLHPDHFVRLADGPAFSGYRKTQLRKRIASGDIPPPVSLADDGKAMGWFGRTILAWQQGREEKAAAKREAGL